MDITGFTAVVTGGNKGIGFEVARQLGDRGAAVVLGARDADRGAEAERRLVEAGIDAHAVQLDVTDDASIASAAAAVRDRSGRTDILVNNAGIVGPTGDDALPTHTSRANLQSVFDTNVFGMAAVTNAFIDLLRDSAHPRIVNVSSEVASFTSMLDPQHPFFGITELAYASSKSAVNMLTAMYSKELKDQGVLVNAAIPGWTATDFNDNAGPRSASESARVIVELATLDDDGPTGSFWGALAALDQRNGFPGW